MIVSVKSWICSNTTLNLHFHLMHILTTIKILQPHSNDFKLHVFGEWTDNLYFKFSHIIELANTHLVYKPTLKNFSGTDLEQDAESFLQLIGRRIIFASGGCPATWQILPPPKKALFPLQLRQPATRWNENNSEAATIRANTREHSITMSSDAAILFGI